MFMTPFMSYKDRWGQYYKGAGDTFPVGIGTIAGYLEAHGHSADAIEPDVMGLDRQAFLNLLKDRAYDLIGIGAFTPNVSFAYETAALVKSASPQTKVLIGGGHPTLFPRQTLEECDHIDYLIANEGEIPSLRLLKRAGEQPGPLRRPEPVVSRRR